ncbi:MAG: DUF47 domain-containing protein [Crocosphaera sp.]
MSKETPALFGRTKFLEGQIDEFLDKVAEGAIYFERGISAFLEEGSLSENCEEKLSQITALKERCKDLRRSIINVLYSEMLIPDFRANVLSLLTDLFSLLDIMGKNFQELMIERDQSMETESQITQTESQIGKKEFLELVHVVVKSVETVIIAARNFFRDPKTVRDHIYQVRVYESEADQIAVSLKKKIFRTDFKFSHKINLRDTVDAIDALADQAENVADKLDIYAIQRTL